MAFIWKHPKSKFWFARFYDLNGKRRNRSTKEKNRKQAEKIAEEYEAAANRKRTALQTRRVIAALHSEITGEDLPTHTIRSFFKTWLASKKPETAPATMEFYRRELDRFLTFLGARAEADIAEINREDILKFRNAEAEVLAPKTVNHAVKCLRMVFKAAKRDGAISDNPAEFVDTIRARAGDARARRPFSVDELRALVAIADDEWKSMILFGLYSGQRLSDIASLRWSNVNLQTGELRLVTRKTGRRIIIPLAGPLKAHVQSLSASDDPAAPVHPRAFAVLERQGKAGGLSNQFAALLARAGLRDKQAHRTTHGKGRGRGSSGMGLSFHSLRHTAVSLLKDAGIPAATVMELVGHDSEQMSEHYTHVGRESLTRAAESFPDILK